MRKFDKIKDSFLQLKGLTTIGITDIGGSAISAVFWLYMASTLGAKDYGQISYLLSIASIASSVSMTGASNTLMVYTAKNVKIQSAIYVISISAAVIASIVVFFVFQNFGVSLYIIGAVIFGLASAEILGSKKYVSYSRFLITQKILMVVFSIVLYYLIGIEGVIIGIALGYFPYLIRIYNGFKNSKIEFGTLKSKFGFMMNSFILNLANAFSGSADKIIIAPILGFTLLGNYQLGIQVLSVLQILPNIAFKYMLPQEAGGNPNKKLKILIVFISVLLTVCGILLSPIIIPALFAKYTHAVQIIQILSLSLIPMSVIVAYQSKFLSMEKSNIILISAAIYLVTQITFIVILGKIYGINGMASAFVLATLVECLFYVGVSKYGKSNPINLK